MKLDRLISFFATNPSAKLLRSPNAAYIVYFLNQHFKLAGRLTSPQFDIRQNLSSFLDELHESAPEVLKDNPETYLTQWSLGDSRWLSRFYDQDHAESVYQLTPHTEDVLKFLTELLDRSIGFVGTESRLKRIIDTLSDIVVRGSDDPTRRLDFLRAQRDGIEAEIQAIESGAIVPTHSPTAIRERFVDAVSDLTSLQGDFRAVEDSFKRITRDVQKQQHELSDTRGEILGFALDAEDRLRSEDQGVSFYEFVRLILSQTKQEEVESLIAQVATLESLSDQSVGMQKFKGMIQSLSAEAEKVLRTTRRLSSTLRRLLDSKTSTTRLRLASILREIQTAAAKQADAPPTIGVELYTELDMLNVSQRTFWEAPVQFEQVALNNSEPDEDDRLLAFRHLAELQRLDWEAMRTNVIKSLVTHDQISLPEILKQHSPLGGTIDVLGYIQIAHDGGHFVDELTVEEIYLIDPESKDDSRPRRFEIPKVIFLSENLRLLATGPSADSQSIPVPLEDQQ